MAIQRHPRWSISGYAPIQVQEVVDREFANTFSYTRGPLGAYWGHPGRPAGRQAGRQAGTTTQQVDDLGN